MHYSVHHALQSQISDSALLFLECSEVLVILNIISIFIATHEIVGMSKIWACRRCWYSATHFTYFAGSTSISAPAQMDLKVVCLNQLICIRYVCNFFDFLTTIVVQNFACVGEESKDRDKLELKYNTDQQLATVRR
jgi:hypothetical protein